MDPAVIGSMMRQERPVINVPGVFEENTMALPPLSSPAMERYLKPFGKTGKTFYVLGLGLMWTGRGRPYLAGKEADFVHPEDHEIETYLHFAFSNLANRLGQVLLDTAAAYGPSEERIGQILRAHPLWMNHAFIATKGGEEWDPETGQSTLKQSGEDLVASFERSLARLGKINLFYIHQATLNVLQDPQAMEALRHLKKTHRGGLEHLGISISRPDVLDEIMKAAKTTPQVLADIEAIQLPARVFRESPDAVQALHDQGMAIVLNRPHLAAPATGEEAFYRQLADRPEVSMILGGGRRHLQKTAAYFTEHPIFTPGAPTANRLHLFKALRVGDMDTAHHLLEAAYVNSHVADRVQSMTPLGIDSLMASPQKIGVGDLLIFANRKENAFQGRFYQVKEAHYVTPPSDLDEPTYAFTLQDLKTGDFMLLRESDWYKQGGNPGYDLTNFYWLGSADDLNSDQPLLNIYLAGELGSRLEFQGRKNLGLAFHEGEIITDVIRRNENLAHHLFHKPDILLPQVRFYLNGKSIPPAYRLKADDRMATVQVLDYFIDRHPKAPGAVLMTILTLIGAINQLTGLYLDHGRNRSRHPQAIFFAA